MSEQGMRETVLMTKIADLQTTNKALLGTLEDLVELKDDKDLNGKNTFYDQAKPRAWNNARAAVAQAREKVDG